MGGKACNLNRTQWFTLPPFFFFSQKWSIIRTIYFKRSSNSLVIAIGLLSPISDAVCIFSLPLWEISAERNWGCLKFQRLDVCFPSVFSHLLSVVSDVSRKAKTCSLPRSPKRPPQPQWNRKQSRRWRQRKLLRSLHLIVPWPPLASTLQVRQNLQLFENRGTL